MNYNLPLFRENIKNAGVAVSEKTEAALDRFAAMLIETNEKFNLTAITDPDGIAVKHFADSLSPMAVYDFKDGTRVLDIGTGAGFPGMPLLTANPGINLTFMDSTGKKLDFVADCLSSLGLSAETLKARAEEAGKDGDYRESFDIVISRAVAPLNILCEYALPFAKAGGVFIAMKGAGGKEELEGAKNAIRTLGGKIRNDTEITLTDGERHLIVIEKTAATPHIYPRAGGKIKKNPL